MFKSQVFQQEKYRQLLGRFSRPKNTSFEDLVDYLARVGHQTDATELLFGCDFSGMPERDGDGLKLYRRLYGGRMSNRMYKELAQNHVWSSTKRDGISVEVRPGEFFSVTNWDLAERIRQELKK